MTKAALKLTDAWCDGGGCGQTVHDRSSTMLLSSTFADVYPHHNDVCTRRKECSLRGSEHNDLEIRLPGETRVIRVKAFGYHRSMWQMMANWTYKPLIEYNRLNQKRVP